MSVCGGWSLVKHAIEGTTAITLWCRSWTCHDCAPFRIASLKKMAMDGNPTTFITLTVNPQSGETPTARAQALSNAWKIVVKRARRKWLKAPLEYMAVFEETKRGEPHLHILCRAPFIPQHWLSDQMNELIAAPIVDIRKVGHVKNAARYVAKYVGKGPKAFASLKRYWQSKNYAPAARKASLEPEQWANQWRVWKEPLVFIRDILAQWGASVEWINEHEIFTPTRHTRC